MMAADVQSLAIVGTADEKLVIDRVSADATELFSLPMNELLGRPLFDLMPHEQAVKCRAALAAAVVSHSVATLWVVLRERAGRPTVRCKVVLLPLRPRPSCAFVFLPVRAAALVPEINIRPSRALTVRESEIVTRLREGDRVPAIAAKLFLSQSTVRNHLASVFSKLEVSSQQQLLDSFR
jgi:DNA-binding CsgD family transcriptional regulator